jgi:nucleoside-diphosphate-sugar epimerase
VRVLVTGAEGYIGAILLPYLAARGIEVTGLDTGYYRDGWLYSDNDERPRMPTIVYKDLRRCTQDDVAGFDAIVHLAELSNDPLGENRPEITRQINYGGSVHLAQLAQRAGIQRFVYTSSCSAYGLGTGEILDETSPTRPQTEYARCKIMVEESLGAMASKDFCPVFLRNATAYGASPRMRFDIVLNDLSALAWTTKQIKMISDGTPWRPLVHVADICEAIRCALLAPAERVSGQIMNVGADKENYRVREIAEIVAAEFPGCQVSFGGASSDNRSYRVAFAKIRQLMPDFECRWSARDGARQLHSLFERLQMPKETYEFRAFTRLKQLKYLQATQQIDEAFFWRPR